jgi:hypothetical protein
LVLVELLLQAVLSVAASQYWHGFPVCVVLFWMQLVPIRQKPAETPCVQTPLLQPSSVQATLSLQAVATLPGVQAQPSLGTPLQFASSPVVAQESLAAGGISPAHIPQVRFVQVCIPDWQFPVSLPHVRVVPLTQLQPPLGVPSQLASLPAVLQSSAAAGATAPTHADQVAFPWQVSLPA